MQWTLEDSCRHSLGARRLRLLDGEARGVARAAHRLLHEHAVLRVAEEDEGARAIRQPVQRRERADRAARQRLARRRRRVSAHLLAAHQPVALVAARLAQPVLPRRLPVACNRRDHKALCFALDL